MTDINRQLRLSLSNNLIKFTLAIIANVWSADHKLTYESKKTNYHFPGKQMINPYRLVLRSSGVLYGNAFAFQQRLIRVDESGEYIILKTCHF